MTALQPRSAVYFYGVLESFIAFILAKVLLMLMPTMVSRTS